MPIEIEKYCYFCIMCGREVDIEMPEKWEPSPFITGQKCESCGKKILAYQPPATNYNGDV